MGPINLRDLGGLFDVCVERDSGFRRKKTGKFVGPIPNRLVCRASRAVPTSRASRESTSRRRTRRSLACARAPRGRPIHRTARRDGRHQFRRSRIPRCPRGSRSQSVAATVVAPSAFVRHREGKIASRHFADTVAPEKALELLGFESDGRRTANYSRDGGDRPRRSTATTIRSAASRFCGIGKPCASTELSSATTGLPERRARSTSGMRRIGFEHESAGSDVERRTEVSFAPRAVSRGSASSSSRRMTAPAVTSTRRASRHASPAWP